MQARVVETECLLYIYLRATYMLAFLCRIPFNPYLTGLYIPLLIWLKHPFLQSHVISDLIRSGAPIGGISQQNIATPPNCNFSERHAQCRFGVAFQHKSPEPPPPPYQLHASIVAHNHASCMPVFRIAYHSSQNTGKCMYSLKIPIPYPFFRSSISNPILQPPTIFDPE